MRVILIFILRAYLIRALRIINSHTDHFWGLQNNSLDLSVDEAFKALDKVIDGSCRGPLMINDTHAFWSLPIPLMLGPHQLPRYECTPKNAGDIVKALVFANTFGLKVNTKVHGHSMHAQSAAALPEGGNTTLLICMEEMNSVTILNKGFVDTCSKYTAHAVKAGGGIMFGQLYEELRKYNYSFVGGTCNSVGFGGGWSLDGGMSHQQQRKLGLGADNVLQFEILLSTGIVLQVDHCSHPLLFKALRGGGGGFGIILSVVYPLFAGTQVQLYTFAFSNKTIPSVNYTKWWEAIVFHTPTVDNRFTIYPQAFMAGNWGFPSPDVLWTMPGQPTLALYFLGSAAEAEQHSVFHDFKKLIDEVPASFRNFSHISWNNLADFKLDRAWRTSASDPAWNDQMSLPAGGWGVPMKFLIDNPIEATHLFEEMANDILACKTSSWYHYGGQVASNQWMSSEEVVNPNIRSWSYWVTVCSFSLLQKLANKFPLEAGGGWSPNHYIIGQAERLGVDYINGQWGQDNFKYLLGIKQLYDPANLLGCRDCVGWSPRLANYTSFITNPMYLGSLKKTADPYLKSFLDNLQ